MAPIMLFPAYLPLLNKAPKANANWVMGSIQQANLNFKFEVDVWCLAHNEQGDQYAYRASKIEVFQLNCSFFLFLEWS